MMNKPILHLVPLPMTPEATAALLLMNEALHPIEALAQHAEEHCAPDDLRRIESVVIKAMAALEALCPDFTPWREVA